MREVYITKLGKFLPNKLVSNDEMEDFLGMVSGNPSKAKGIILRSNGIKGRYYALNRDGSITHSNVDLCVEAVKDLFNQGFDASQLEYLACGTTSPDQLLPSHAVMVHGKLGLKNLEAASFTGSCCSSIHGLKSGIMSVASGNSSNAVCVGSERISPWMRAGNFEKESENLQKLEQNPYIAFDKEFLRWMLSDGAAAVLLQDSPGDNLSLRVDWLEITSFANELETCMYAGALKEESGDLMGYYEFTPAQWLETSVFSLKQDVKLLRDHIVGYGMKFLREIIEKRNFSVDTIDYFLPHLSSFFFRDKIAEELESNGMPIPKEKWFTNLENVGNVGSASAFLMLEELVHSGKLKKGERILVMIPESARFSYAYLLLTVC
ncbi:MAG: hypothetical protein C0594_06060 [Marinilabiliales bacterium]|nr:MAG: hypothetical protein C0594_06060 [Marinilabiliales bacterium]